MRNKNKIKTISIILGTFFVMNCSYLIFNASQTNNEGVIIAHRPHISGYWSLNYINIDDNWSATAVSYAWCSGDGSWGNPYTIENVTIDATGSPTGSGFLINNSKSDYFVIRNCTVYNAGFGTEDAGIRLENTNNGFLKNNNCSYNGYNGITLFNNSDNNTISDNNIIYNLGFGINLNNGCDENIISGNDAFNSLSHGIRLIYSCSDNSIVGNNASYNTNCGIRLRYSCDYNLISGNNASNNNWEGIYLQDDCDDDTISDNMVTYNGREAGVYVRVDCDRNSITGNTISNNNGDGLILYDFSSNNYIGGNTINNNDEHGLITYDNCNRNTILTNTINNNSGHGIRLRHFSDRNRVLGNKINNSLYAGILLRYKSDDNIVSGNIITHSTEQGIYLREDTDNNTISGNIIKYNTLFGIQALSGTNDNLFFLNCFIGNTRNVRDTGDNQWDNGIFGNYWDNYSGGDFLPIDGIGDTPHSFAHDKIDTKPIMNVWCEIPPIIPSWYPMPNLKISYLSSVVAYNKTSFSVDFSITNNGIWKAEGVVIVLQCVELALTLFDNSLSPLLLDVDETKFLTINSPPIGQIGDYTLTLTVDPFNTILETYSSKDGSLRIDAEDDNSQTASLTILSEEIEDPPEPYTPPPPDMIPMVISSIAGVIGLVAIVLVFMRTKSRAS